MLMRILGIADESEDWMIAAFLFAILALVARWSIGIETFTLYAALVLFAPAPFWLWLGRTYEPYRLSWCVVAGAPCGLAYYSAGDPVFPFPAAYAAGVALAAFLAWPREEPAPQTHGSAQWANAGELRQRGLLSGQGIRLGYVAGAGQGDSLRYDGDRHLLTVAPTRSGKGATAIIPNLLTYRGSVLVIDPKGENALVTWQARRDMGQAIYTVDPWGVTGCRRPSCFNPLDWLVRGDIDMTENAMLLADALIVPQSGGDQFWREEAKALLQGFILYVATDDDERFHRHLGRVRDLLLLNGPNMQSLFERMAESPHHVVASTGARSLQKEERLLGNVLASAQAETHFLDSGRMRESLSASDFKFEDLKKRPMTIYLVLPADRLEAFGRWLRLLIQQAITVNARDIGARPDKPVLFILDEMPALGRLAMVEQAFGLMAGFGMQLWAVAQDLSQLKRIYGASWESFVGNAGAVQYFGSRDRMTAEYFSALCGVTTIETMSESVNRGGRSHSRSKTTAAVQRKLAFPDELMRMDDHRQLVLIGNNRPIIASKVPWFNDPELKRLGQSTFLTVA